VSSSPTDFDGRRRLASLRASESQTDALGTESDDWKSVENSCMPWLLKTLIIQYAAKASATSHSWYRRFQSISSSVEFLSFFSWNKTYFQKCAGFALGLLSILLSQLSLLHFIVVLTSPRYEENLP
jgi:hypothetical protein